MKFKIITLLLLVTFVFASCKTLGPPSDEKSSGLYGFIEFEEGHYFRNIASNLYFVPVETIEDETREYTVKDNYEIIGKGLFGQRTTDNTFWIGNLKPGRYRLVVIQDAYQRVNIFIKSSQVVEVKEGEIAYWGALYLENNSAEFVTHFDVSRTDVLDLMTPFLTDLGWEEWLKREQKK